MQIAGFIGPEETLADLVIDEMFVALDYGAQGVYTYDAAAFGYGQNAVPTVTTISIDITDIINPKSHGVVQVAIETTSTFDPSTVDLSTVRFGVSGTESVPVHSQLKNANGDVVLQFRTQDTGIVCGSTSASLTGTTFSGQAIRGWTPLRLSDASRNRFGVRVIRFSAYVDSGSFKRPQSV